MRFNELIEVGQFKYPVKPGSNASDQNLPIQEPKKKDKDDRTIKPMSTKSYSFTTDSGIEYSIFLVRKTMSTGLAKITMLEIVFGISPPEDAPEDQKKIKTKISKTGDAIKIFSTVYQVLVNDLKENGQVDRIMFSGDASEPTRIDLYDRIVKNISKYLPKYKFFNKRYRKYSDYYDYMLIRK